MKRNWEKKEKRANRGREKVRTEGNMSVEGVEKGK